MIVRCRKPGFIPSASRYRLAASVIVTSLVKEGHWPGLQYPRVTGHEVAGVIDAVGPGVTIGRRPTGRRGCTADIAGNASLSPVGFHGMSELSSHWIPRRRRVCPIHDCTERSRGSNSRLTFAGRGGADTLRWCHDLQQLATQRCASRRRRWRCRDWVDLGIWASSLPVSWAIAPWPSGGPRQGSVSVEARLLPSISTQTRPTQQTN